MVHKKGKNIITRFSLIWYQSSKSEEVIDMNSNNNHRGHDDSRHDSNGHDHGGMIADFQKRFWVSLVLTMPILALSRATLQKNGPKSPLGYRIQCHRPNTCSWSRIRLGHSALTRNRRCFHVTQYHHRCDQRKATRACPEAGTGGDEGRCKIGYCQWSYG